MSNRRSDPTLDLYRNEIYAQIDHSRRLRDLPIDAAMASGEVLGPGRVDRNTAELVFHSFQFKFRKGDQIQLCLYSEGRLTPVHKQTHVIQDVCFSEIGVVRMRIDQTELITDPKLEYFIVMEYDPKMDWILRKKLQVDAAPRKKFSIDAKTHLFNGLNTTQADAIETVLGQNFSGVIQGPPGTGKTEVLARLVKIAIENNLKVAVLSFTNRAVDNALNRIIKTVTEGVIRVGDELKVDCDPEIEVVKTLAQIKNFKVYGTTTHKFLFSGRRPPVDVIILDEASQIPSYFLAGLKHSTSNIVMIGDQQQLPPIILSQNYTRCEIDCFSLFRKEQTHLPMLETQYRMNETIQDWSSKRYYDGKLKPHHSNAHRDYFRGHDSTSFGENVINYQNQSFGSESLAHQVLEYAREAQHIADLSWDKIGIIAPHRIHASRINQVIQEELGVDVNNQLFADTVDRYQGREKEFIIFSLSDDLSDPAGFINDYRRINVAITRARSRFYVVSDYRHREGEELSEFLQWCESISNSTNDEIKENAG